MINQGYCVKDRKWLIKDSVLRMESVGRALLHLVPEARISRENNTLGDIEVK